MKGSFTRKATTDSLDWDMDSPLSSPPASFPSSPRDAAPATGVRVPRVQTDASGFNAPSGGDHLTQSGGMYRPPSDVEAMHDFSIERPTRSRIKALNAALLTQQEPVGSPAGSAVASSARETRGRKRKFASPSVVQEVRDCSERKSKRAKRIVTTDTPTLETGGMSAALEQEPSGKPQLEDTDTCVTSSSRQLGIRTFPPSIPVQHQFSQIYRRFPVLENNLRSVLLSSVDKWGFKFTICFRQSGGCCWCHAKPTAIGLGPLHSAVDEGKRHNEGPLLRSRLCRAC